MRRNCSALPALRSVSGRAGALQLGTTYLSTSPSDWVRRALAGLQPEEAQVLRLRYGFGDAVEMTTAEIGRQLALPDARIRQIEANALRKLRHSSCRRRLRLVD